VARYFTIEEAREVLEQVRPLAEALVERHRALRRAMRRQAELVTRIGGNGGGIAPGAVAAADEEARGEAAEIEKALAALQALGVQVKDIERGLVDFPSLRDGEEVLLCWHAGEDDIRYWHGLEEGFAGRRPLDEEP
jgi:hypothetical protein